MRVLQINSVCGIGSTGRIASDIHNLLKEQGYESFIAYGRGSSRNCDNPIKIGTKLDNYTHVILTRLFDKHGFGSKNATDDFVKYVDKINPDIIHLHNIHGYYINIEILFDYLKAVNKPVIWTLHDCWAFTGHCTHFDYVGCDKWKNGCYKCPQKKSYPKSLLMDNSEENYKRKKKLFTGLENMTIVTPSNWLACLIRESFLNEYPIKVINNGIDLDIFKPTESNFRKNNNLNDKFIILGVASNWDNRKGFKYFLEISKRLKNDEVIVLVGLTKKQIAELPKNILGIARTNNAKELASIYSAANVFINPTLEDNFPTTNLEALACGTPIITFDTGGSVETINENCGFIVKKGDIEQIICILRKIKSEENTKLSSAAILRVNSCFNKTVRFYEYIELYKGLLIIK